MIIFDDDNNFTRIFSFLKENDDEFIPSLSSRVDLNLYAKKLANFSHNIFARNGCIDVGHASIYANDKIHGIAFLSSVCVVKQQQGSNIAAQLIEKVVVLAKSNEMLTLDLEVCSNNNKATAFYHKYGFEIYSHISDDILIMKLHLGNLKG